MGRGEENERHSPSHIANRNNTLLLTLHGLGEQPEGLLDVRFLVGGDVVLLRKLGLAGLFCA